ncbi:unnamed protein product [Prunus armeniaca]|uniref:Uncharacterized protein n=1 Tax=Prunus armeniaca TaxID=36596 RepID=A0A6J5WFG1_PRUAR|nr:unnamed protein product [Prunus armeniaca]
MSRCLRVAVAGSSKDQLGSFRKCKQLDLDWHNLRPNLYWHRFGRDMVGRQGRARAEDSAEAWLFTLFVITHVVEGQSFPLPCEPLAVTDFHKQAIVNLGEEYLPSWTGLLTTSAAKLQLTVASLVCKGRSGCSRGLQWARDCTVKFVEWLENSVGFDSWARPEELGCETQLGTTGLKDYGRILMFGECGRGSSGKSRACEIVGRGRT